MRQIQHLRVSQGHVIAEHCHQLAIKNVLHAMTQRVLPLLRPIGARPVFAADIEAEPIELVCHGLTVSCEQCFPLSPKG